MKDSSNGRLMMIYKDDMFELNEIKNSIRVNHRIKLSHADMIKYILLYFSSR